MKFNPERLIYVMKVYSVYDEKALVYGLPTCFSTDGLALRSFADLVSNQNSNVNKYPSDFKLYRIGEFNDANAEMISITPVYLAVGTQYAFNVCSAETTD